MKPARGPTMTTLTVGAICSSVCSRGHDALLLYDMPAASAEFVIDGVNLHPSQWVAEFGLPI